MADLGISIIAEKLLEVIASEIIEKVCDMWSYKSQLEDLRQTVSTIKKVFRDAEAKRKLSNEEEDFIKKLKDAVYDADDLFDEFLTLAELKQLRPLSKSDKLKAKVCSFFSSKNQVGQAYRMSREVKEIKKRLDVIADNHKKFGFEVDYQPISRRREETCSYVDQKGIIGREKDKKAIVDMLLDPNVNEDFCFVTIVGVGGLGKTALAQLVYNDEKIKQEFTALRLWVCVSDQDGEQFDVKAILCKITELVADKKLASTSTMEFVQNQFQKHLRGKKYLLVLDDVWNEDRQKWLNLKKFLMLGQGGSRIVVTTRSEMTATIIGDNHAYKLKGLSQEDSRHLFNMSAFEEGHELNHPELGEIGRKIVEKCYGIPLALKVIGTLLFGQDISKWQSFEKSGLAEINSGDNMIMSILKLSYHNLEPSLKCCFTYCAIFPKDHLIKKEVLISLWIAQGYVVPWDRVQDVEEAAEEHFRILLRRCFFQDVEKDGCGDVKRVKIHDLMHDVAQEVGREEIHGGSSMTNNLGDRIHHVYDVGDECLGNFIGNIKLRSIIYKRYGGSLANTQLDNWMYLRVLDLSFVGVSCLPDSIGKLLLLRYLNLTYNDGIEVLPDSITKLHNLQTLVLRDCTKLRELPKDFGRLVKLRHLDLSDCDKLNYMPLGMDKMTSLRVLRYFVVGERIPREKRSDYGLEDLKALTKIKGKLCIKSRGFVGVRKDMVGGCIKSMKHLTQVKVVFDSGGYARNTHEAVMEKMEPASNLKGLTIKWYGGTKIPRWGRAEDNWAISLPNLVSITLSYCSNLQEMPMLSKLPFLKSLSLSSLRNLEYIEINPSSSTSRDLEDVEETTFFPSLESLKIDSLDKLRGWWKGKGLVDDEDLLLLRRRFQFPRLLILQIKECRNLTSLPPCPSLQELMLSKHKQLNFSNDDNGMPSFHQSLRFLKLLFNQNDTCLPKEMQYLTSLQTLELGWWEDLEVLPEWIKCLSSLQSLSVVECLALKSLPDAIHNLTSLQKLEISYCPKLSDRCKEPNGEDWPKIKRIPNIDIR